MTSYNYTDSTAHGLARKAAPHETSGGLDWQFVKTQMKPIRLAVEPGIQANYSSALDFITSGASSCS